ncbi:GAF domain-containing protein [candidate division KSB1 bacterium]|nr:GAF domain-containing protein [candidate division KSB1 bacterium]
MLKKTNIPSLKLEQAVRSIANIATKIKLDAIYDVIIESIRQIYTGVKVASVLMVDKKQQELKIVAGFGLSREYQHRFSLPIGKGATGLVARTGEARLFKNVLDSEECPEFIQRDLVIKKGLGPLLSVPMKVMNKVIGVINVYRAAGRFFAEEDCLLLQALASQAVVSIQNANLFQQKNQERDKYDMICSIARELTETIDIHSIISKILDATSQIVETEKVMIFFRFSSTKNWRYRLLYQDEIVQLPDVSRGQGIQGYVVESEEPCICKNVARDDRYFQSWKNVQSEMAVPLKIDEQVLGALDVQSEFPDAFTKHHQWLLMTLANEAAVALRNVQLFTIADQKNQELITLSKIGEAISHEKSLKELLNAIADASLEILGRGNKVAFALLKDSETNVLKIEAGRGESFAAEHIGFQVLPDEKSIVGWVARHGKPRHVPDVRLDPEYKNMEARIKSELAVPLVFRNEVIGVIDIESTELNAFTEHDEDMLQVLADNAAIATKIGELFDIRLKQLQALYKTGTQISASLELMQVLQTVAGQVFETIGSSDRTAYVQLLDEEEKCYVVKIALGRKADQSYVGTKITEDEGTSGWVVRNQRYRIVPDVAQDPYYQPVNPDVQSEICVPVMFADEVIGLINVESLKKNDFGAHDLYLLEQLANQASVAITNAQLTQRLAHTQYQLHEALEVGVIGEALSGLSHDIRTCSSLIAGEAQWVSYKCNHNAIDFLEVMNSMEKIEQFVKRIENYTSDLSRTYTRATVNFEKANLADVFRETLPLVATRATNSNVRIRPSYPSLSFLVEIDIARIKRVILNIVINAIDAMEKDGGDLMISGQMNEEYLHIRFQDTGMGIAAEDLKHVWERFYTSKEHGTGLGLNICKRIIENDHSGRITIESVPGEGTTVSIQLPCAQLTEI